MTVNGNDTLDEPKPYPVKSVVINTCAHLYQQWAPRKRMYAKAAQGLTVKVDYADTVDHCHSQQPITILALHGAPGSHEDFKPFIEHFGTKQVRIIVPNYPGKSSVKPMQLGRPQSTDRCTPQVIRSTAKVRVRPWQCMQRRCIAAHIGSHCRWRISLTHYLLTLMIVRLCSHCN